MTELTKADKDLWKRVTQGVTPLGQPSMGPVEGHQFARVSEPRTGPYDPRLDLHGVTVHMAYGMVLDHVTNGAMQGFKRLTIITGRSGQINVELPRWLEKNANVRSVNQLSNGGSWEVLLKRNM